MEHIDRHFVDRARRVVARHQAAVQLRRDMHRIVLEATQAANAWLRSLEQAERVRSTPADPAG